MRSFRMSNYVQVLFYQSRQLNYLKSKINLIFSKSIFGISDVTEITGKNEARAADFLYNMLKRKLIIRLTRGKYMMIPAEAGYALAYVQNYYVVARELASPRKYYLSHYSAMAMHNMLTQPVTKIYISTSSRVQNVKINNIEYKFIFCNPKRSS